MPSVPRKWSICPLFQDLTWRIGALGWYPDFRYQSKALASAKPCATRRSLRRFGFIGWMVTSFLLIDYSNMLKFYSEYIYIYIDHLVVCPLLYTMVGSSFKSLLPYPTRPFQICKVFQSTTGWRELITFSSSTRSFHVHSTHGCEFHQARNTRLWWSMRPSESRHQPPSKGAWESDQSGKSLWKLRILVLEKTFMLSCHVCPD